MEINIDKYLSEEDKKNIAIGEYKQIVKEGLKSTYYKEKENYERVIGNSIFEYLETNIDKELNIDSKELIREKVKTFLERQDYSYSIFRQKSTFEKEDSIGYKILQEAVIDNKSLIIDKVKERMSLLKDDYFDGLISDLVYNVIKDRIVGK